MAHEETKAYKALNETVELSRAVKKAVDLTSEDDTLIVVSAGYSHGLAITGYPYISNDILGESKIIAKNHCLLKKSIFFIIDYNCFMCPVRYASK